MSPPVGPLALCAVLALVAAGPAGAQEPAAPRERVGLVLSGGGALGLAHVGVVEELERLGVRPDIVVGASMGAVVGGLYASGYTGQELDEVARSIDWDRVFDADPRRDVLSYRQKQQQAQFPVRFNLRVKDTGVALPRAALADQNLMLALRGFVRTKAPTPSFDELPIRFRAVATDLETGEAVALDRGDLATAMRASMAVPGIFAPVEIDGRLLTDGGVANNLPIDVARAMGATRLIVVAMDGKLRPRDQLASPLAVVGQSMSLLVMANERRQLATLGPQDVLIAVDVHGLDAAAFGQADQLVERGVAAARAQSKALAGMAATAARPAPAPPPLVNALVIENHSILDDEVLRRRLRVDLGRPLDVAALNTSLNEIYALGYFERIDYEILGADQGHTLQVKAEGRPRSDWGALRTGFTFDNNFEGRNAVSASMNLQSEPLDAMGSHAEIDLVLGDRFRLSGAYVKYLGASQTAFIEPALTLQSLPFAQYDHRGYLDGVYQARHIAGSIAVGWQFGRLGEVRVGYRGGRGSAEPTSGDLPRTNVPLKLGEVFASAGVDTFDNAFFPAAGLRADLAWTYARQDLGASRDFQTLEGSLALARRLNRRTTVIGQLSGGAPLEGRQDLATLYRAGGFFSLAGYQPDELSGEKYAIARIALSHQLNQSSTLLWGMPIYVGATLETGDVWSGPRALDTAKLRTGASVYIAADSFLGPIYLAYGRSRGDRSSLYLFLGRPF
ncbi:MAG: patatin-like phospholipase family protein [Phenylobacterium sp.]|nr:patatin-like phospholipase family protein [Phenylobacterium sp.]